MRQAGLDKKQWLIILVAIVLGILSFIYFNQLSKENKNNIQEDGLLMEETGNKISIGEDLENIESDESDESDFKIINKERELTEYEKKIYSSYDKQVQEIEENDPVRQLCAVKIDDKIEQVKENYVFYVNNRDYDTRINANTNCQKYELNCYEKSYLLNKDKINQEIAENEYNLVNGCLYKNGVKVLNYDLVSYSKIGYFTYDPGVKNGLDGDVLQYTNEWFRFQNNNKLFIFLTNTAPCGGCAYNGHYLEIDLASDRIQGKYQDGLYKYNYTFLSPNKKHAIVVDWDKNTIKTSLYLYDFTNFSKRLIYTVPEDKSILESPYYLPPLDVIAWIDNKTVKIQLYEKAISKVNSEINTIKHIETDDNKIGPAIESGEPVVLNIGE